jgi:hypothetical protein
MEGENASFWLEQAAIRERLIILAEWERMLQTSICDLDSLPMRLIDVVTAA